MNLFKRILTVIVIIISIVGIILCLAGIVGVWAINTPLTNGLVDGLTRVEGALTVTRNGLGRVDSRLAQSRETIDEIDQAVSQAGDKFTESSPILTLVTNITGVELEPKIEAAAETVSMLRGTVVSVNNTLEAANAMPFVSVPMLPMDKLQAIDDSLSETVGAVQELRATVADVKSGAANRATSAITTQTAKIDALLQKIQTPLTEFESTLDTIETDVTAIRAGVPGWIDLASVIITLALLWFILAQISLFVHGWQIFKQW